MGCKYALLLETEIRKRKRVVGSSFYIFGEAFTLCSFESNITDQFSANFETNKWLSYIPE